MSARLVSCTHIRALVSAASLWDKYHTVPLPPKAMLERYPTAFKYLLQGYEGHPKNWLPMGEDELGRALWLANLDSLNARYSQPDQIAEDRQALFEILSFRHALVELPAAHVVKACDCYDYQSCEVPDWGAAWANTACSAIREAAISELTKDAPWGIDDPPGGPLKAGTAGAPVSLMSIMREAL